MPTRERPRRNLSLDPAADALLREVGNASDYVSRIVVERDQRWRAALRTLRMAGWAGPALLAACDALNGYAGLVDLGDVVAGQPGAIAAELADAAALSGICERWDVSPDAWRERIDTLPQPGVTSALIAVVREFWTSNAACEDAVRAATART